MMEAISTYGLIDDIQMGCLRKYGHCVVYNVQSKMVARLSIVLKEENLFGG
jgi:hypothetical protein